MNLPIKISLFCTIYGLKDIFWFLFISLNEFYCEFAGLYCTHQDISPEYASILLVCLSVLLFTLKEQLIDIGS